MKIDNIEIAHIASDEKFINSANSFFEEIFPEKNIFYILVANHEDSLLFVEKKSNVQLITQSELLDLIKSSSFHPNIVFFHSLNTTFYPIVLGISESIIKIWGCFGYEVYNDVSIVNNKNIYFKQTYKTFIEQKGILNKIKYNRYIRTIYRKLVKSDLPFFDDEVAFRDHAYKKQVINHFDYLCTSFDEEYINIKKLINNQQLNYFELWYNPLEKKGEIINGINNEGLNILIGNSATTVCNHLDVIEKIREINVFTAEDKFILPLSYGSGGKEYSNIIKQELNTFHTNCVYLEDFIPLEEYNNILSSCQIAIIASRRQHAVSNIISLIWGGAKVFLSFDNPFYHYLKRIGIIVFSYEDDLVKENLQPLNNSQIAENKKKLYDILNRQSLIEKMREQVNNIIN